METAPVEKPRSDPEKSKQTKVIEYALSLAVKAGELNPHDASQTLAFWNEAEAQMPSDNFEVKMNKVKKSLGTQFGPRANSIFETVLKRRKETVAAIQDKQRSAADAHKSNGNAQTVINLVSETPAVSNVPAAAPVVMYAPAPQPQQLQQPPVQQTQMNTFSVQHNNLNQWQPQNAVHQQQLQFQQLQQYQQQGQIQQGQPQQSQQTVPPITQQIQQQQMQLQQQQQQQQQQQLPYYGRDGSAMLSGSGGNLLGGFSGYGAQGGSNLLLQPPGVMNSSNPISGTMQHQHMQMQQKHIQMHQQQQQQQQQQHHSQLQQQQQLALAQQKKQPKPKKKEMKLQQPPIQQHLSSHSQSALFSQQPPHPMQHQQNSSPMPQTGPSAPLSAQEEVDLLTEKPNLAGERMEFVSDHALSAPLMQSDFLQQERLIHRQNIRVNVGNGSLPSMVGGMQQHVTHDLTLSVPAPLFEEGQEWQYHNVLDRPLLSTLAGRILGSADLRISDEACSALWAGIQQHLKNLIDSAAKAAKCRTNKSSLSSYEGLAKMVVEHGKGAPLPENQLNIAMKWAPDVGATLEKEEQEARRLVREAAVEQEKRLCREMAEYDEERSRSGPGTLAKRKLQEADSTWWYKEDVAEKAGQLDWQQLADAHFKIKVAQKYELAMHQPQKKKASKQQGKSGEGGRVDDGADAEDSVAANVDNIGSQFQSTTQSSSAAEPPVAPFDPLNQPCPLKSLPRNLITEEDVVNCIAPLTYHKSAVLGIGYSTSQQKEGVGRSVQRWKMGLDLQQFISNV